MATRTRKVRSEEAPRYGAAAPLSAEEQQTIEQALAIIAKRLGKAGAAIDSPARVREWIALQIGSREHEVFCCLYLNQQHRMIGWQELFRGTLAQTSVYPREVAIECLKRGAAAVVVAHCHPSGMAEPSRADHVLTQQLKQSLALVDVNLLDHVIAAGSETYSFAEHSVL